MNTYEVFYFKKGYPVKVEFVTIDAENIEQLKIIALQDPRVLHKDHVYKIRLAGTFTRLDFLVSHTVYCPANGVVILRKTKDDITPYYTTKEEALKVRAVSKEKAKARFEEIAQQIHNLENSLKFTLSFTFEGDSHGIHDDGLLITLVQDGIEFDFMLDNN